MSVIYIYHPNLYRSKSKGIHVALPYDDAILGAAVAVQTVGDLQSDLNVYCGNAIQPHNEEGLESLAIASG